MLSSVGRGLAPAALPAFAKRFVLTCALPPDITFTRASAATYLNAAGQLVSATTNIPRFDHDARGYALGLMIEGAITNKNTNYNANPTATTGFTTTGDANGVLSVVDDTAALSTAGLHLICSSGKVYKADNSAGSGSFSVYPPGTCGNTNKHSASLYIRSDGSGRVCRLYIGQDMMDVNEGPWTRYKLENQTPDSSGRKLTITVDAGEVIYFILNQLEENAFASSVIVTSGSSASRSADRPYIILPTACQWFDSAQGYIACRYFLPRLVNADSYVAVAHDGSSANAAGLRLDSSAHDLVAYLRAGSSTVFGGTNDDTHIAGCLHGAGITWKNGHALILSGGKTVTGTPGTMPSGITRIDLGSRNGGSAPLWGHIQMLEIGRDYLDARALGARLFDRSDITLACGGQSLMAGHFSSQQSGSEAGKQTHRSTMGTALPDRLCVLANGATGSSAACNTSNAADYWWDVTENEAGPALDDFYTAIDAAGLRINAILWAQGEEDSHHISIETSRADYKTALLAIFNHMRSTLGEIPVFIQRIGRRTGGYTNTGGIQAVREVQQEIIDAFGWCHSAAEIYDLGLYNNVHLDDAGYVSAAVRNAQVILPVFDAGQATQTGPRITDAIRTGTTITLTLSHDHAADFTPASAIEGFRFDDNGTPVTIAAAVRTDAVTVTLTLASAPLSGVETLYYGYDSMSAITPGNTLHDTGALSNCLRTTFINL